MTAESDPEVLRGPLVAVGEVVELEFVDPAGIELVEAFADVLQHLS